MHGSSRDFRVAKVPANANTQPRIKAKVTTAEVVGTSLRRYDVCHGRSRRPITTFGSVESRVQIRVGDAQGVFRWTLFFSQPF